MALEEKGYLVRFRYEGGEARDQRLDLYDGTDSMHGFARAVCIATHAFVNKEVIHKATAVRGAKLYLMPPRRGSFLNDIWITIQENPVPASITAAVLYDFLKYSFRKTIGFLDDLPETSYVSKLNTDEEPFFDDLALSLEGPLVHGHRPIQSHREKVSMERRTAKLVTFDIRSREWVETRDQSPDAEEIRGIITRYNVISGNGRLYDRELRRTVPFNPIKEGLTDEADALLSWSLDQANNNKPATLSITVQRIVSARGETKRFILLDCKRVRSRR